MNPEFWKGKRVFLTGHTGFKGSWMSLWLQQVGADVTGYALEPNTNPSLFEQADVGSKITSIIGDVRDNDKIKAAIEECKPEIVFHLAAQPLVGLSFEQPLETYEVNVMGTANTLDACRSVQGLQAIVVITSDKCYENREWMWGYRENEAMGGFDPYSNSKGCAELVTSAYRQSFFTPLGIPLASARAGNVIGGGDWADNRLVPDVLKAYRAGMQPKIRNGDAIRPWQHVLEPIRGYLVLAEQLTQKGIEFAGGWNFGPEDADAVPVRDVINMLAKRMGKNMDWDTTANHIRHEAKYLKLDISKARAKLNWFPKLSLSQAIQMIVDWETQAISGADIRLITQKQISDYNNKEARTSCP